MSKKRPWPAWRGVFLQLLCASADWLNMMTRPLQRILAMTVLVAAAFFWAGQGIASSPEAGERGRYRAECRRLTKQINHYEKTILPMAIERRNAGWEKATNAQVERLWHRRADLCPEYGAQRTMMAKAADQARKVNKFLATAGRAAASYFTGGLAGGLP